MTRMLLSCSTPSSFASSWFTTVSWTAELPAWEKQTSQSQRHLHNKGKVKWISSFIPLEIIRIICCLQKMFTDSHPTLIHSFHRSHTHTHTHADMNLKRQSPHTPSMLNILEHHYQHWPQFWVDRNATSTNHSKMERCIHCKSPAKNSLLSLHMAYATRMRMHAPVLPLLIQHAPQHMKVLTTEPLALQMASISSKMMMWRPLFMPHCGHNTGTHHSQSQHLMLTLIACRFVLFAVLLFGGCCCCFFSLFFPHSSTWTLFCCGARVGEEGVKSKLYF